MQSTTTALERLKVAPANSLTGYSRDKFGGDWATTSNGCDVRERVSIRDGQNIDTGAGCRITGGRWRSIYDGKTLRSASKVDIDHVVPLAEAWRSGARSWSAARRERFANDLREPQLVAVSASSNRSKGDSPPPGMEAPAPCGASMPAGGSTSKPAGSSPSPSWRSAQCASCCAPATNPRSEPERRDGLDGASRAEGERAARRAIGPRATSRGPNPRQQNANCGHRRSMRRPSGKATLLQHFRGS